MSAGELIYAIVTPALISFPIALACWKFFKWKLDTCTTIGAAAYGGISSLFGLVLIAKWPMWFITLMSISIYVILQRIIFDYIVEKYGEKEV